MAAVGRDSSGVIRGFFDLGIVEPGTDMTTIQKLVDVLLGMAFEGVASADIANRILSDRTLADDVMRTIYDWPIILRGELVYFGRAVALIEGIGARYVPDFNPVAFAAPVILKHRRAVLAAMGDDVSTRTALGALLGTARWRGDDRPGQRVARDRDDCREPAAVAVAPRRPGRRLKRPAWTIGFYAVERDNQRKKPRPRAERSSQTQLPRRPSLKWRRA